MSTLADRLADLIDPPTFERALKRLGTTPEEFPRLSGAEFSVLLDRYIQECADWMRERGLSRTFMDWLWHDDEHDPITAETWSAAVALLNRVPLADPPPVLLVALPDDERLVLLDVATDAEKRQAIRTALVTACRLHDALVEELLTARALLAGDAG